MNNNKFDVITITGEKFVCCCDCGKWFPSTEAFTKVYSSTAFMLCPKCANQLEQEIRRYKVKETPAADVVLVRHERWEKHGSKWQCTGCKVLMSIDGTPQENLLYYCPNCGAKMDKEEV